MGLVVQLKDKFDFTTTRTALEKWRERHGIFKRLPAAPVKRWGAAPSIDDDCACLLDLHVPCHDARFVQNVAEVARAWGIRRAVLDEDGLDLDWLSWWVRSGMQSTREAAAWREFTTALLDWFPDGLDIHAANHGQRIRRLVDRMPERERNLLTLIAPDPNSNIYIHDERMRITPYAFVYVQGVRVGHPSSTGRLVGHHAMSSYDCDCVLGHTHYAGVTYDGADNHVAVESGMCADPKKLKYNVGVDTGGYPARPRGIQRQGAALIKRSPYDGKTHIHHLRPRFTDFEAMKRMYA